MAFQSCGVLNHQAMTILWGMVNQIHLSSLTCSKHSVLLFLTLSRTMWSSVNVLVGSGLLITVVSLLYIAMLSSVTYVVLG